MTKEEMDFIKEMFSAILDLNLRDDGIIYTPGVCIYDKEKYAFLISCYLQEPLSKKGDYIQFSDEKFFDTIDRCAKRLLEDADVNKGIRIKKLEEELACLKELFE